MLLSMFQTRPLVYILISIYVFHSIVFTSFRVLYSICTRDKLSIGYNRPTQGRPYCVVAASLRIYGFRRGWKIDLEKGFGFCTGVGRLWGSSGLQERQRYWYRSTGSLGFQHLGLTKKVYSRSSTGTVFPTGPRGLFLGNIGNW